MVVTSTLDGADLAVNFGHVAKIPIRVFRKMLQEM